MDTVTGGGSYKIGENVTLTATPNRGYRFVEWQDISGKKVRENASYTITKVMTGQTLIAAFQPVGKTVVTIPTITNATYNNTEYVGVATGANYTLAGTTKATDTGAYTVTATLNGENTVWSDGTTEPKTLVWNIFKATPESAPTEISATDDTIIGVNTTMEYRKQGDSGYTPVSDTTISALTPGTYYVRVKGDDNHNPSPVTVVTVKEPTLDVKTLQPSGLTSTAATLNGVVAPYDESKDYKIQFLLNDEVCNGTPTVEKGVFTLIVTDLKPDADYTVKAVVNNTESAPVIFHTPKATPPTEDIGSITVNAAVEDGTAATFIVSVERGNDVIASKQLSGSSTSFTELPYGNYNVVIRTNDGNYTETKMLSVADAQEVTVDFDVPKGKLATIVDVKPNTPKAAVDGLGEILTTDDKDAAATGSRDVEVKLEVEKKVEDQAVGASEIKELLTETVEVDFLDMSLLKTTTELDADGNPTSINAQDIGATNNKVLEIAVPYNNTNKTLKVLRYHNGMAEELTKLDARPSAPFMDGTYFVGDGYVFIYASGFSTYAIGYEQESSGDGGRGGKTTTYAITGADTQNGKVTLSGKFASAGRTVTVKVTPDEGYKLDTLTAKDAKGNALTLTRVDDNTYTFQMPASKVTVSATFAKDEGGEADTGVCKQDESCVYAKFPDADPKAWYHPGVHFCVEKGYMNGVAATQFAPGGTLSRGMIVTMLWRMEDSPVVEYFMTFGDVEIGLWYTEAIRWAQSTGVVTGYDADTFGPNDNVTREQLAAILMRYADFKGIDVTKRADLSKLDDASTISGWALENVKWANAVGIINGRTDTTIAPTGNATRAEAANMVQRFCENILR